MKTLLSMTLFVAVTTSQAFAAGVVGTSELKIKLYKLLLSTSPLCTDPITVVDDSNPQYTDLVTEPTLFSGAIPSGRYSCVILEVSDQWIVKPTASDGTHCASGVESTWDICSTGISTDNLTGTTVGCTTGEDHAFIYMSTAATGNPDVIMGVFQRPTSSSADTLHGYNLAAPFQVSGSVTSTLTIGNVLNTSLQDDPAGCMLANSPHFIFQ